MNWWMSLGARGAAPSLQDFAASAARATPVSRAWSSALGVADTARSVRRLEWSRDIAPPELPDWGALLRVAFGDDSAACARRFHDAAACHGDWLTADSPYPFELLVLPLAQAAEARVSPALQGISGAALEPLRRTLIAQLTSLVSRLLYAHFSAYRSLRSNVSLLGGGASDSIYEAWEASMRQGGILRLLHDYPVAARLLGTRAVFWGDMLQEFVARFDADVESIGTLVGHAVSLSNVARVSGADSDPHNSGRQVLIVQLVDGGRVVYKPRSLAMEVLHDDLLAWVETIDPRYAIRSPKLVNCDTHGWMEFIDAKPVASVAGVRRFYERAGALLALYYAIGASDLHFENLIASGEHPIVVDHEMLLGPEIAVAGTLPAGSLGAAHSARHTFADSVLRTALLPMLKVSVAGDVVDVAGLATTSALAASADTFSVLALTDLHTDQMQLSRCEAPARARPPHAPVLDGRCVPVSTHVDALLAGFDRVYAALLARRAELTRPGGVLARVGSVPVRVLVRATNLYAQLAARASHPEYLRDPFRRRAELEVLARPLLTAEVRPMIFDAVEHEIAALERLDIPCFTVAADSTTLYTSDGQRVGTCLDRTPLQRTVERLAALSESDRLQQCWIIRTSLGAADAGALRLGRAPLPARRLRAHRTRPRVHEAATARIIADEIASAAVLDGESPLWHALVYDARARRFQVGLTPLSWLDGTLGIGAFLAESSRVFQSQRYRALAVQILTEAEPCMRELRRFVPDRPWVDVGVGTGLGSALAGIAVVTRRLGMPVNAGLLDTIRELIADAVDRNACGLDLTSGLAGAVLGAVVAFEQTGDVTWQRIAGDWGETMMRRAAENEAPATIGMAHGLDGVAFALRRLAGSTGSTSAGSHAASLEAIARHAWRHTGAGLRMREREAAWSHGATGLLLARLAALDGQNANAAGRDHAADDIRALLRIVRETSMDGSDDLCCGRAGRAEVLSIAAEVLGAPDLAVMARQMRQALSHQVSARLPCVLPGESDHPSLLTGRAGIGLTLLRGERQVETAPFFFSSPARCRTHSATH